MSKFLEWVFHDAPPFISITVLFALTCGSTALFSASVVLLFYGFWLHIPIILALPIIYAFREYKRATEQGH